MPLASAQVIDSVAARVAATALFAGARTCTDRGYPFDEAELPAARVLAGDEEFDVGTVHTPQIEIHDLDINAELRVTALSALDDAMHAAAAQVLTAMHAPAAVSARAALGIKAFRTVRIERRMDERGQAKVGAIDITFRARFATRSDAPETILGAAP